MLRCLCSSELAFGRGVGVDPSHRIWDRHHDVLRRFPGRVSRHKLLLRMCEPHVADEELVPDLGCPVSSSIVCQRPVTSSAAQAMALKQALSKNTRKNLIDAMVSCLYQLSFINVPRLRKTAQRAKSKP